MPTADLVRAVEEFDQRGGRRADSGLLLMPVVDGGLLPVAPAEAVAAGSAAEVPLLIGTTRDEMAFFTVGDPGPERPRPRGTAPLDAAAHPRPRGAEA